MQSGGEREQKSGDGVRAARKGGFSRDKTMLSRCIDVCCFMTLTFPVSYCYRNCYFLRVWKMRIVVSSTNNRLNHSVFLSGSQMYTCRAEYMCKCTSVKPGTAIHLPQPYLMRRVWLSIKGGKSDRNISATRKNGGAKEDGLARGERTLDSIPRPVWLTHAVRTAFAAIVSAKSQWSGKRGKEQTGPHCTIATRNC